MGWSRSFRLSFLELVDDLLESLLLGRELGLPLAEPLLDDLSDIDLEALGEVPLRLAIHIRWVILLRVDLPVADDLLLDVGQGVAGIGELDFQIRRAEVEETDGVSRARARHVAGFRD